MTNYLTIRKRLNLTLQSQTGALLVVLFHVDLNRFDIPDFVAIFANRAVCREFAHIHRVNNRHPSPLIPIAISIANPLLAIYVRLVICHQHILVSTQQRIDQRLKEVFAVRRKITALDAIDNRPQLWVRLVILVRIVSLRF